MIDVARSGDHAILQLLERHPQVGLVERSAHPGIWFRQGEREREVLQGASQTELYGLVEFMDNNPLVCANRMSVPTPVGILAAIALGPIIDAGLLLEPPTGLASQDDDVAATDQLLARMGSPVGVVFHANPVDLRGAVAATVIAAIQTPERLEDIDDLYNERFGRSFFVHRHEEGDWDVQRVKGGQNALYRLRIARDEPASLLTIQTMADGLGKCGAGALIHAMNVMAGMEESLGLNG